MMQGIIGRVLKLSLIGCWLGWLAGCSPHRPPTDQHYLYLSHFSARRLWRVAHACFLHHQDDHARRLWRALDVLYPLADEAKDAQRHLLADDMRYRRFVQALAMIQRYRHLHPLDAHLDYITYMQGLLYEQRYQNWLQRHFLLTPYVRDVSSIKRARQAFSRVCALAHSAYSRQRMCACMV